MTYEQMHALVKTQAFYASRAIKTIARKTAHLPKDQQNLCMQLLNARISELVNGSGLIIEGHGLVTEINEEEPLNDTQTKSVEEDKSGSVSE